MNVATLLVPILALFQPAGPKFSAQLYAADDVIPPGDQTELAIKITIQDGWHIYDPIIIGTTGLPTTVSFNVPAGVTIGELRFPAPYLGEDRKIEYLAHDGTLIVLTTLRLAEDAPPGPINIKATVSALACRQVCMPVEAQATLVLNSPTPPVVPDKDTLFEEARAALPPTPAKAPYMEGSQVTVSRQEIRLDEPAEIVLTLRVKKGHHIQAPDPGVEGLIGSRLFVEPLAGIKFAEQQWPKPHVRHMQYFGKVRELSGEFKVRLPFTLVDGEFPSGPVALRVLFTYQCCSDAGMCFPPVTAESLVRFVAQTPNAPLAEGAVRGALFPRITVGDDTGASLPGGQGEESSDQTLADETVRPASEYVVPELAEEDWAEHIPWQTWRPGLAQELSRRGHLVYVDYTASWCPTCQANKRVVLETQAVRSKMRELGVIPIKADFTIKNLQMQKEINRWRPTVPVNVIYLAGQPDKIALLPVVLTRGIVIDALENPEAYLATDAGRQSLLLVLLAGFLGGLILNVMPCVLPVISIKILSFVQQAGEDPKRVLRLGLAFCAGIMVWFWAFAALASAGRIPWQYPEVVIALASILFVFSLNLFGVFEVMLPGAASGKLTAAASREGYSGAFMKGLLATLLGTACTAPFLAGAMAYALTQPAWIVLLVFTAAGLGMASPYLILSAKPAWLKFVPKPGQWMVTFKQAAGFVLLGTVVWLLWILSDQLDGKGVVWTVAFWGFLGLATWMLGKRKPTWQFGPRAGLWIASVAVAALGFWFCYFWMYDWNSRESTLNSALNLDSEQTRALVLQHDPAADQ